MKDDEVLNSIRDCAMLLHETIEKFTKKKCAVFYIAMDEENSVSELIVSKKFNCKDFVHIQGRLSQLIEEMYDQHEK